MAARQGRLLPAGSGAPARPYVAAQILADLGETPMPLASPVVKRIRSTFPVPAEQQVLWADVALGTRSHGLVLTDAGLFLKDGPASGDEDDDDEDDGWRGALRTIARSTVFTNEKDGGTRPGGDAGEAVSTEQDGLGYLYIRWESFDAARVSHVDGAPTLDGARFLDGEPFRALAMACVRVSNRRVRARRAARACPEARPLREAGAPSRSVCRSSARRTLDWCFDGDGLYKFYADEDGEPGRPLVLEVPADQYDAALVRMRAAIRDGRVPGLEDPDAAGALVRRGDFTFLQASNLAGTGRVPGVSVNPKTGSVVCRDEGGLSRALAAWLRGREALGAGVLDQEDAARGAASQAAAQALTQGAQAQEQASKDPRVATGEAAARMAAGTVASSAGYAMGATASRAVLSAVGMASGPLAMVASMALGDVVGRAGNEAMAMAKDMLVEPREAVMARLFNGVLSNVVFEHALTGAEQELLARLIERAGQQVFLRLGAELAREPEQERSIRALIEPMVAAVRRA